MQPTIHVDTTEWTRTARAMFGTEGRGGGVARSLVDFINGQALFVVSRALHATVKANAAKIEYILGGMGPVMKVLKQGKRRGQLAQVKGVRHIKEDSFAARILHKIHRETGNWQDRSGRAVPGGTMLERINKFINRRKASVAFIKSGWIPAIRKLSSVVKFKPRGMGSIGASGAKQIGVAKGKCIPATYKLASEILCIVENDIPGHVPGTMPIAAAGLRIGFAEGTASMAEKMAERLKRDHPQFT